MQIIVQNMDILPRSFELEQRQEVFFPFYTVQICTKKDKMEFQCRCALQYAGRISINDFNKLRLTYFNVDVITFICLEPL